MPTLIRERTEALERESLSSYAKLACASAGRAREEKPDPVRTCFQQDRDRILHCKSFRRLKHKTQVFIDPSGDHYRTRLTHTLEVAQIARTIARALRINEDLTEAIALGHDVGHPPFGHAGEEALDEAIREFEPTKTFKHYEQSVRVLTVLEKDGKGLNLTWETIEGIRAHSKGHMDLSPDTSESPFLEAAVVRVADRIAYLNHDLDDALRAGMLRWDQVPKEIQEMGEAQGQRIGYMVTDLIESSFGKPVISFSDKVLANVNAMKDFLFERVYLEYPKRYPDIQKAKHLTRTLFHYYLSDSSRLPESFSGFQGAIDYVAGMTDRFAIQMYIKLFVPVSWGIGTEKESD